MAILSIGSGLIVVAGISAVSAMANGARLQYVATTPDPTGKPGTVIVNSEWVYPMPILTDGTNPTESDGWGSPRDGGGRAHKGNDVMYRRKRTFTKEEWKVKSAAEKDHNSRGYYVPVGTPLLCVKHGKIWSITKSSLGIRVMVDHGKPYASVYQHGGELLRDWKKGDAIRAGELIMTCGYSLKDAESLRHLHFEFVVNGEKVDPAPYLAKMRKLGP